MSSEKKAKQKRRAIDNIKFSIGAKLITIITIIVVLSLGSITALVSWLVRTDLRIAAEDNNFETNRRSALEAESTLANVRSNSRILIQILSAAEPQNVIAREAAESFFEENTHIAALFFTSGSRTDGSLVNSHFFHSRGIEDSLAASYRDIHITSLRRAAAGDVVLLNATPNFDSSMLAMFFPWKNGGGGVLFSPSGLNDTFGYGTNQSYLINDAADILVHSDFELVRAGANIANQDFIRNIMTSPDRNRQRLIEVDSDFIRSANTADSFFSSTWKSLKWNVQLLIARGAGAVSKLLNTEIKLAEKNISADDRKERLFMAYTKLNIAGTVVVTSIEYDKVFEGIAATTRRNLYLTGAVLCISIMCVWFFAKSISIPLKALASGARKIEGGIFELELRSKSRDEIGVLTSSFQRMCTALGIFGRFTNRDIAVKAMRGQIKPGGLPKHATIFFSDIRGFTEKSENFTKVFGNEASDRIVFWLNSYLSKMVECVEKTNGAVDKFIGDAVMAHWGTAYTSGSPKKDAFNCVAAALEMRKALYYMNRERKAHDPGNPPINIGCGINTGIVTAGQIGSELRMEYTVIGDPVNLASRVEALNKPLGTDILITENTWNLVKYDFITEEMPSVTVKGKEKPVRIFAVVNFEGRGRQPDTLARVREVLGIEPPDMSKVDLDADEKKYKIDEKQGE